MSVVPLAVALLLLALPTPAAAGWRLPVPGSVTRAFDVGANPYEGGRHRGVDLAARPGASVRAPCGGHVAVAGRVGASGGVVTLLCGHWRVTHMPLATITVRAGTNVTPGMRLGTLARGHAHAGLHLGVRRAGTRFGYVDPLRFLAPTPTAPPALGRRPRPRPPVAPPARSPAPAPNAAPVSAPADAPVSAPAGPPVSAPAGAPVSAPANSPGRRHLAPWPVWLGLALVLAGAGVRWRGGRGAGSGEPRLGRELARRSG